MHDNINTGAENKIVQNEEGNVSNNDKNKLEIVHNDIREVKGSMSDINSKVVKENGPMFLEIKRNKGS